MKLSEIKKAVKLEIINDFAEDKEVNFSTDTRTIKEGDFYIPLRGANFDGEKFLEQAFEKGAVGAFVTQKPEKDYKNKVIFQVENTLTAYLELANYKRKKQNYTVVAITGSSGKTTTKELIASVLTEKYNTFKTPLNHNNEIGFCQTVFEAPDNAEVLVLEMGMRGFGEIKLISKYSEPDITVISNVGTAHIGRLGSRENIAKAKCEIVTHQRGNTFIAHNDELIKKTVQFNGDKIYYSLKDVNITKRDKDSSVFEYKNNTYELSVGGDYNIENALAAINVALKFGLNINEIQQGLKQYKPIEKRWESVDAGGFKIINDSYNANPESMRAFLDTVLNLYENPVIILGDMGELGEKETEYHREIGQYINNHHKLNKEYIVLTVGNLSKNISEEIKNCKTVHFQNTGEVSAYVKETINKNSTIFLKASRSMKLEEIIKQLSL